MENLEDNKRKAAELEMVIENLKALKLDKQRELYALESDITNRKRELTKGFKDEEESLKKIKSQTDEAFSKLRLLQVDIEREQKKLEVATSLTIQKEAEKESVEREVEVTRRSLKEREAASKSLLDESAVKLSSLTSQSDAKQTELASLEEAINGLERHKKELEQELEVKRQAFEDWMYEMTYGMEQWERSVEKRERWNEQTKKKLSQYKADCEDYYKREFRDIIV